jgi:hypothetical protein
VKFKSHAVMQGSPELKLRARTGPVDFQVGAEGSVKLALGPFTARVDEVPVTLTIPFLRRGGGVRTIGSVGPFSVRVTAVDAEVRPVDVRVAGVVGKDGLDGNLEGKVGCRTELDVEGTIPGKVAKASFEMVEGEEEPGS